MSITHAPFSGRGIYRGDLYELSLLHRIRIHRLCRQTEPCQGLRRNQHHPRSRADDGKHHRSAAVRSGI